ncbi:MAG: cohesin domain-containing protein [Nitrospirae bacterium]|nr:cohesin domain-containing protein [Nitrospirota bacterium]
MKRIVLLLMTVFLTAVLMSCAGSQAFQRGERYSQSGEWDMAVKEYREANRRNPKDIGYRSALLRAEETAANHHYKKARSFLKERKLDQAITELQQAIYLNPTNVAIQSALRSVLDLKQAEEHYRASLTFVELARLGEAINELSQAVELDPDNVKYHDSLEKLRKEKTEAEPDEALTLASDKPITLNFKNTNIKDVFEFLSKLSGINILFDEEVKAQPVTVFVKDVSFQYAMNLLLSTNKLFMKKVSADTIIIIPKNKAKSDQYQDLLVRTFYINNAKSKEIVNLLRIMLDIKKVYVNEVLNAITVRDTPEKMKLVEKVIAANDLKEAEIILDVEILEISRTNALKYGWNFTPGGLSVSGAIQSTEPSANTTTSGGGISMAELRGASNKNIFLTLPGVVVNLIKRDSDAQTLANPRVRVLNNKKATFHVGERIPIQTSVAQTTATTGYLPTSTFDYKDVGIKLNIEPTVHLNNTVTLSLKLEISTLGDALNFGNGQIQYKFGTRTTETLINLRDGETVIIGGLIKDEERKSRLKIPILGDIPILGKLFSSADDGTIKTDILMSITPNIVRGMEIPDKESQAFWSGTELDYNTKPLFVADGKSSKPAAKSLDKSEVLESLAKREVVASPVSGETSTLVSAPSTTKGQPLAMPAALIEIKPTEASVSIGQEARFDLLAGNMKDLYGAIVTLTYDPKVIEFKTASEGSLLKKDNQQTSFLFSNNIKGGTVDIYMTRIGDVGGVDGAGSLGTLVFQAKSGGASMLTMKGVKITNFKREQIKTELKGAKVLVK